ncbi:hypothetical protein ES319_A07G238400v1 [Gossypium barbadense]|uniref:CASP-like protein n=1 Tax=Gossypium barbadense TaxID=3634 RepID=A0A5J5V7J2_GOSBA|nr:hypothetical protein ES319_A07G238400v1 [Gossypium barbadense]
MEEDQNHHQKQEEEAQHRQHQYQNHEEKDQQPQKHEERVEGPEQKSPTVSQSPLTQKTTQSPPSYHSPIDSPLSSCNSPLSHGFSPSPTTTTAAVSHPSEPNSKPPSAVVSRAELTSRDQSTTTTTTVELEEQTEKLGSGSAADKNQGWALDSFYRYKEFRFCMAVNVIGFVYSGFQAYDVAFQLTSGKQKPRSDLRFYLDFILDQILAYLLISASSSAAVRVDDWESNWGNDKFPEMARASVALSLVAFIALALSSLVSGYNLCTSKSI